jgi:hypothetical protein
MRAGILLTATGAALLSACGQQEGGAQVNSGSANNAVAAAPEELSVPRQDANAATPLDANRGNAAAAQLQAPAKEDPARGVPTRDAAPAPEKLVTRETAPQRSRAALRDPAIQRNQTTARPAPKEEPAPTPKPTCTPEHREMGHC